MPVPMSAAHAAHDGLHVGEVHVDDAVLRDEIADALHGLEEDLVGLAEGVDEREVLVAEHEELLVRDGDERVDLLGELGETELGATRPLTPLEEERLGHDADGERAFFPRELRDDGRCARSGPAAHAGGDEDHVRAGEELLQALHVLEGCLPTALGVGAGAEALGDLAADVQLRRCGVGVEGLSVSVHDDELDPFEAEVDHRVDRVSARAAAADDLDARLVFLRFVRELDRETHDHPPGDEAWCRPLEH